MNNLLRETMMPKGGSDSTSLRKYATNLIFKMLPGAKPFSVSHFIWFDLIRVMDNGIGNFPYAPYVMYIIEHVTGLIFKKDGEHHSYQIKQWSHQKCAEVVRSVLKPQRAIDVSSDEGPSSAAAKKDKGGKKIRSMLRDVFAFCKYNATQTYELRKDVNKLLFKADLSESHLVPPPTFPFFPDSTSSETNADKNDSSDNEPLSAKLRRARGPKIATRKTLHTPTKPMARMLQLMRMKALQKRGRQRTPGAASDGDPLVMLHFLSFFFSLFVTC
jgi:hypothetical protein